MNKSDSIIDSASVCFRDVFNSSKYNWRYLNFEKEIYLIWIKNISSSGRLQTALISLRITSHHYSDVIMSAMASQITLQWRHNERDGVSNHRPPDYLLNCFFFKRRSKETSKLRIIGLCEGNSPLTDVFLWQRTSNAENVSIWWRHHVTSLVKIGHLKFQCGLSKK